VIDSSSDRFKYPANETSRDSIDCLSFDRPDQVWLRLDLGRNETISFCDPFHFAPSSYFTYESRLSLHFRSVRWTWNQNFTARPSVTFQLKAVRRDEQAISVVKLPIRAVGLTNASIVGQVNTVNFPLFRQPQLRTRLYLRAPIEYQIELRPPPRSRFVPLIASSSPSSAASFSSPSSSSSLVPIAPIRIVDLFGSTHVRPPVPLIWGIVSSNESNAPSITSTFHVLAIESEPEADVLSFAYTLSAGKTV
jgi:hypothetical protein